MKSTYVCWSNIESFKNDPFYYDPIDYYNCLKMRAVRDKADNIMIFLNNTINDINLLAINIKPLSKNLAEVE